MDRGGRRRGGTVGGGSSWLSSSSNSPQSEIQCCHSPYHHFNQNTIDPVLMIENAKATLKTFVESSLSINEVVAWILMRRQGGWWIA